jgi:hypothetical protein
MSIVGTALATETVLGLYTDAVSKGLRLRIKIYKALLDTLMSSGPRFHIVDTFLIRRALTVFMLDHQACGEQQVRSHFQVFREIVFDLFGTPLTLLEFDIRQHYLWWIRYAKIQIEHEVVHLDLESLEDIIDAELYKRVQQTVEQEGPSAENIMRGLREDPAFKDHC